MMQGKYHDEPDAYGNMEYGVGFGDEGDERGDWYAYADFQLSECGRFVWYHVVVNSESGAFIDTVEERELTRPKALKELPGLLYQYLDIAAENLTGDAFTPEEVAENQAAIKKWQQIVHDMLSDSDTAVSSCGNFESYTEAKNAAVSHKVIHENELRKKGFTS